MTQYAKRKIDVTIRLGEGQFGDDKGPDVTLTGLRVSVSFVSYTGDVQAAAQIRIYGLPLAMINRLTNIGPIGNELRKNDILVAAGDEGGAMSTVYQGQILSAYGDFNSAPEVVLNISALAAAVDALKPVAASSYRGAVDAAIVMADLAKMMGRVFENNGVSVMLQNPYFPGTALEQVKSCATAAGINYSTELGKLVIWPRNGTRTAPPVKISSATGMVGYPSFSSNGLMLRMLFNPDVELGRTVQVDSELPVACGIWSPYSIAHTLESETPNGQWFTDVACYPAQQ